MENPNIGKYKVFIQFIGDSIYRTRSAEKTFSVIPNVNILKNISVGDDLRIQMDLGNSEGSIVIFMDARPRRVQDIVNGKIDYTFSTENLTARDHSISFQYYGDSFDANVFNYWDDAQNKYLPIKYAVYINPKVVEVPDDLELDDNGIIALKFPEDATGSVGVFVDGIKVSIVEIINGIATIDLSQYKNWNYEFTFQYLGNDLYEGFTTGISHIPVSKITASNVKVLYNAGKTFSVKILDSNGNPSQNIKVVFKLSNKQVGNAITNAKGVATYRVTNAPGTYKITTTASDKSITKTLTVTHVVSLKTVKVKKSAKKLVLTATLKKVNGKYLKSKKVTFKFNGKKYTAKTNKNGVAKVTVKKAVLKKLKVGKKIIYQATYGKDTVKKSVKVKK